MDALTERPQCIDAHHHLWRYNAPGEPWMTEEMSGLRRDFFAQDLEEVASASGITGTVVIEVTRTADETLWLTSIAERHELIRGVVGWTDLTDASIESALETIASLPKLKGIRHPIHDEPDDNYVARADFNRGIAALEPFGLTYDLLIFEKHLPQTAALVDRHPNQIFILDHVAKPHIRDGAISPWREDIIELARRQNVYCKLSGMVTEANWKSWTRQEMAPYIDVVLEAFGPQRLMFGSDWPLVTLASTYGQWLETVREAISQLSNSEQDWILWRTATEAYWLG
jgi:L-fuconolactonase